MDASNIKHLCANTSDATIPNFLIFILFVKILLSLLFPNGLSCFYFEVKLFVVGCVPLVYRDMTRLKVMTRDKAGVSLIN